MRELENAISPSASWHADYRDTAFLYVGGLPFTLSEGDVIAIFSQFGEPVWIKLARDKETGKNDYSILQAEDELAAGVGDGAVESAEQGGDVVPRGLRVAQLPDGDHVRDAAPA